MPCKGFNSRKAQPRQLIEQLWEAGLKPHLHLSSSSGEAKARSGPEDRAATPECAVSIFPAPAMADGGFPAFRAGEQAQREMPVCCSKGQSSHGWERRGAAGFQPPSPRAIWGSSDLPQHFISPVLYLMWIVAWGEVIRPRLCSSHPLLLLLLLLL